MSLGHGCYGGLGFTPFCCCTLRSAALSSAEGRVAHGGPGVAVRFARLSAEIFPCNAHAAALPWFHRRCQHSGNTRCLPVNGSRIRTLCNSSKNLF